jgi:putative protein-disulfide isomerase
VPLVPERELIYIGDPMCSWCFGFVPVMQALYEKYRSSIPMRIVVGGLRTGPEQIVDAERIAFLRSHWQQVTARTGQRFNTDILNSTGWLYDTELACRAVVVMRKLQPELVFPYFVALQTVRRQTLWNHLTLSLSDTFLPVTSPV